MSVRVLVIAGSTRTGAYSKKLAHAAARSVDQAGGSASFVDLRDYPMPLYDGDLEAASEARRQLARLGVEVLVVGGGSQRSLLELFPNKG